MSVAKCDLAPPKDVTLGAKSVMGAIDFDPYSTNQINTLVEAARFYDRDLYTLEDIVSKEWDAPLQKRAFIGAPAGAVLTRRLLNTEVGSSIIKTFGFLIRHLIISTFCF